jgi:hypothetical protein
VLQQHPQRGTSEGVTGYVLLEMLLPHEQLFLVAVLDYSLWPIVAQKNINLLRSI